MTVKESISAEGVCEANGSDDHAAQATAPAESRVTAGSRGTRKLPIFNPLIGKVRPCLGA